jgi:tetratricopeptide (TPR) repeat protein
MNELQIHTLLEQASRFYEDDKTLHAIQLLKQVIAASPTCEKAYVMLAQIYFETKRPDFAEKVLLQGLEANNDNLEYYLLLGNLHLRQLHFEQALACFEKIRNLNIPQVHLNVGLIYLGFGRLSEAEAELKRAAALEPNLPQVYELWGEVLLEQKRISEAVEILQHAIRLDQYSGSSHRLLGEAFAHLSQWEMAYDKLVLAVDLNPDDAEAWCLCGDVLLRLNRYAEAQTYLGRSLQLQPNYPEALADYGLACAMLGENDKALEAFESASKKLSSRPVANQNEN